MIEISRRTLFQALGISAAGSAAFLRSATVLAADMDKVTIGWPADVPSWDPEQRTVPDTQPIYKLVFDQPLDQAPDLKLIPKLVKTWKHAPDASSLTLDFRDDVKFHDGSKMTSADFKYSFLDRVKAGHKIDVAQIWGFVTDMDRRRRPKPSCISNAVATSSIWLAFLAATSCRRTTWKKSAKTVSSRRRSAPALTSWSTTSSTAASCWSGTRRIGVAKPAMKNVTFQIIKDPSARVAAIQSGQVDLTLNVPVREADRFMKDANFKAEIDPIERVIVIQTRGDLGFADKNVRLAAHHAIDKKALSRHSMAAPRCRCRWSRRRILPATSRATPSLMTPIWRRNYWPIRDLALPSRRRSSSPRPMGSFPATTILLEPFVQMWKKVGIDAEIEIVEYAKYFELNRGNKLPEATLYSWDNATGDPEMFTGYLLNPHLPFSAWKEKEIGEEVAALFAIADYDKRIAAYKEINKKAVEYGAIMPLLQSVITVVSSKNISFEHYKNGWILANTITRT